MLGCSGATVLFGIADSSLQIMAFSCLINFFVVSAWAILYLYTPESFPPSIRGVAISIVTLGATVAGILVGPIGGYLLDIQWDTWCVLVVFASPMAIAAVISATFGGMFRRPEDLAAVEETVFDDEQ
jgi:MFS family permease